MSNSFKPEISEWYKRYEEPLAHFTGEAPLSIHEYEKRLLEFQARVTSSEARGVVAEIIGSSLGYTDDSILEMV
jgi:hypothetical protein